MYMYANKENHYYTFRDHPYMTSSLLVGWLSPPPLEFTILSYVMTPPLLDKSERWLTISIHVLWTVWHIQKIKICHKLSYFGLPSPSYLDDIIYDWKENLVKIWRVVYSAQLVILYASTTRCKNCTENILTHLQFLQRLGFWKSQMSTGYVTWVFDL